MLIEFAVTNFRSIKERQVVTFTSSGQVGKNFLPDNLTGKNNPLGANMLRSAIFYGANASGKSNFLRAFRTLELIVLNSDRFKLDKPIKYYSPFKLDKDSRNKPTIFEIDFIAKNGVRYIYQIAFDKLSIIKEELQFFEIDRKVKRPISLFSREYGMPIIFKEKYIGKQDFALNNNQLLLSQAGTSDLPSLKEAYRFFSTYLFNVPTQTLFFDEKLLEEAEKFLSIDTEDVNIKNTIISIIKAADTGITDIMTEEIDDSKIKLPEDMPDEEKQRILDRFKRRIKTIHPTYENGVEIDKEIFDLTEESTGTIKLVGIASFVADALSDGSVVIVDELDKNLHPLLTRMIIGLFHNPIINKNNAQLIFSSHDISLFDRELFRRDQIFLTDKNNFGETKLSRLSDFKGISKVIPLQKWYMAGMFKGIPSINEYAINF